MRELSDAVRAVEATLFAAAEPLSTDDIAAYVGEGIDVKAALAELESHYAGRGIELVERGRRWHFRPADLAHILRREREETASSPAPRSRRSPSSPITSRSAAPRSRRFGACRSQGARSMS
jgi:chromosome segregation and condensation protein ScpB